jgi:hypothetical protein
VHFDLIRRATGVDEFVAGRVLTWVCRETPNKYQSRDDSIPARFRKFSDDHCGPANLAKRPAKDVGITAKPNIDVSAGHWYAIVIGMNCWSVLGKYLRVIANGCDRVERDRQWVPDFPEWPGERRKT